MAEATIRVDHCSRGWYATLSYKGTSYQVFGEDGWTQEWPTHLEAMRAAAWYREHRWHKPSDATLAWWAGKAHEIQPLPHEIEQGLQDLVARVQR